MDGKTLARLGAVIFVALAITATVIDMTRKGTAPTEASVPSAVEPNTDPLRDELIRCQLLGEAGAHDAACLRAWAENRGRFLAPDARPEARLPEPIAPAKPEAR
ncbi:putative entry exclusion protein TrbK-alt [Hyphomicrobium sp. 2TAF46]|uniref:putative entry exclusion protein TrbK-alt n=1 Tax=Hyphomicrobium sp. 2TAF46 TaxID=3233019 RepID=UPI003F8E02DB